MFEFFRLINQSVLYTMYSSKKLKIITFHKKIVLQNTPKPSDT